MTPAVQLLSENTSDYELTLVLKSLVDRGLGLKGLRAQGFKGLRGIGLGDSGLKGCKV